MASCYYPEEWAKKDLKKVYSDYPQNPGYNKKLQDKEEKGKPKNVGKK